MRTPTANSIEEASGLDEQAPRPYTLPSKSAIEAIGEINPSPEYAAARARSRAYWEGRMAALRGVRGAAP